MEVATNVARVGRRIAGTPSPTVKHGETRSLAIFDERALWVHNRLNDARRLCKSARIVIGWACVIPGRWGPAIDRGVAAPMPSSPWLP